MSLAAPRATSSWPTEYEMIPEKNRTSLSLETTRDKARPPTTRVVARVPSKALLGEHGELIIEHAGREYRLRQTSSGKLILTA